MRWTTVCDLQFQEYDQGAAVDSSRFRNDATIAGGVVTHGGYVSFTDGNAELVLRVVGDSLQRFSAIEIFAEIKPISVGRRLNVVEGWMSFAFFVHPDGQLLAGIYDGQNWISVASSPGDVPFGQWSQVYFHYDGISRGVLTVDGRQVGESSKLPLGMSQPRQNITVGHWPSGDSRYTFAGDMSRVQLRRRDYEDLFRDAVDAMLCNRTLTEFQVGAVAELRQRLRVLSPEVVDQLRECAHARFQVVINLIRDLRDDDPETLALLGRWNSRLLAAWCCRPDPTDVRMLTEELIGTALGQQQRERLKQFVEELEQAAAPCDWNQPPLDRLRELFHIVVPELAVVDDHVAQLTARL